MVSSTTTLPADEVEIRFARALRLSKQGDGDSAEARELFRWCAEQGHLTAAVNYALSCELGLGGLADWCEAERWFRVAAESGIAEAEYHLGSLLYRKGRRFDEALKWLRSAEERGEDRASIALSIALEEGCGVSRDVEGAVEIYRRFADTHGLAALRLARCYEEGLGVDRNVDEAKRLYRYAGDAGQAGAWHNLGMLLAEEDDEAEAWFPLIEKASQQGCPEAWEYCGEAYVFGWFREAEVERGIEILERAVASGMLRARYVLALCMVQGLGVEQDADSAFRLCREAAELGEADAQYMLGKMYGRGDGVTQDLDATHEWWTKAADQGHEEAERDLKQYASAW